MYILILTFIVFFLTLFFSCLYTFLTYDNDEWYGLEDERNDFYEKFSNRLYYTLSIFSTNGSYEILPKGNLGKILTMLQMFIITIAILYKM